MCVGLKAPEIFEKSGHGKPVDLWAIGVITYFLLSGYTPFERETTKEEMNAILRADYKFEPVEHWNGITPTGTLIAFNSVLITHTQNLYYIKIFLIYIYIF